MKNLILTAVVDRCQLIETRTVHLPTIVEATNRLMLTVMVVALSAIAVRCRPWEALLTTAVHHLQLNILHVVPVLITPVGGRHLH